LKVLYRLKDAGFDAYLVGGGVRDLLLGCEPKDFDIATNAHPDEVDALFRNARLVGRRFRLAHVRFGREIIEVATFRAPPGDGEASVDKALQKGNGRILRDNVYGSMEEDAERRDFTVNGLYYNIRDFSVVDYCDGLTDLSQGILRLIGDPVQRYREDPVRMLRAVRFVAKLGFRLAPETESPIHDMAKLLADIPPARLYEEVLKLFMNGQALSTFENLRRYGLLAYLFPETDKILDRSDGDFYRCFVTHALRNTDTRVREGKHITPAFLFAALLWPARQQHLAGWNREQQTEVDAMNEAAAKTLTAQTAAVSIPKRFSLPMKEIWVMQPRLLRNSGQRAIRLLQHKRFRAAYDFLLLRHQAGEDGLQELAEWWTNFQELNEDEQSTLTRISKNSGRRKKTKRKRSHNPSLS